MKIGYDFAPWRAIGDERPRPGGIPPRTRARNHPGNLTRWRIIWRTRPKAPISALNAPFRGTSVWKIIVTHIIPTARPALSICVASGRDDGHIKSSGTDPVPERLTCRRSSVEDGPIGESSVKTQPEKEENDEELPRAHWIGSDPATGYGNVALRHGPIGSTFVSNWPATHSYYQARNDRLISENFRRKLRALSSTGPLATMTSPAAPGGLFFISRDFSKNRRAEQKVFSDFFCFIYGPACLSEIFPRRFILRAFADSRITLATL